MSGWDGVDVARPTERRDEVHRRLAQGLIEARAARALARVSWTRGKFVRVEPENPRGLECLVWPDPPGRSNAVLVDVVMLDQQALTVPLSYRFLLPRVLRPVVRDELAPVLVTPYERSAKAREEHVVLHGNIRIVWSKVNPGPNQTNREVVALRMSGLPVYRDVSLPWVMTCECGRVRYAKANTRHQVTLCWVCGKLAHARRRALATRASARNAS